MTLRKTPAGPARTHYPQLLTIALFCAWATPSHAEEVTGTKDGKVYHTHPGCAAAKNITPENKVTFKSVQEAEAEGRRLCRMCARATSRTAPRELSERPPAPRPERTRTNPPPSTTGPAEEPPPPAGRREARARKVQFGGTLVLDTDEIVAPLGAACPLAGQELAEECKTFIEKQIRKRRIVLEVDAWSGTSPHRDPLGRSLYYLGAGANKTDLGAELIHEGLAWLDREARFDRRDDYLAAEDDAWNNGRGIWKRLDGAAGKAEVVAGRHAQHYHPAGCPHIAHFTDASVITINEAKARRLTPCETDRIHEGQHIVAGPTETNSASKVTHAKSAQKK